MTLSLVVAQNLWTIRSERKLTQGAVAAKAGLSVSYLSMLEHRQRTPSLETLEKLAKALAIPPLSLFKPSPGPRSRRR